MKTFFTSSFLTLEWVRTIGISLRELALCTSELLICCVGIRGSFSDVFDVDLVLKSGQAEGFLYNLPKNI